MPSKGESRISFQRNEAIKVQRLIITIDKITIYYELNGF